MSLMADAPVYEVFAQSHALSFATHVGSVRAASAELALQFARETFFRRESAYDIWVVPFAAITHARSFSMALPTNPEERTYRLPSGYDNGPHWKAFKARPQTIDDVARDVESTGGHQS